MRWLIAGAAGQVGSDLTAELAASRPGDDVIAAGRSDLDITDRAGVLGFVREARPDVIVNCAAYTAVDAAESEEERADAVNGWGAEHLAAAASQWGVRLIHLSTDYVFAGTDSAPLLENEPPAPLSAYGRSKALGERLVLSQSGEMYVVRTSWVYGRVGGNFVKTIAGLARTQDRIDVVDDQHGTPTWSAHLARGLGALGAAPAARCPPGVWHLTNGGATTWFHFARAIVSGLGEDPEMVHPVARSDVRRPAARPGFAVLSTTKWEQHGLPALPRWDTALATALPIVLADGGGAGYEQSGPV